MAWPWMWLATFGRLGPGGVFVFSPDGKVLGKILTGQKTSNCKFGEDGSSLFITADSYLCRVKTKTKGKK